MAAHRARGWLEILGVARDGVREAAVGGGAWAVVLIVGRDLERDVCGETGSMPRDYVYGLEPFPLDELFAEDADDWARIMLREEFARVTECPVEGRLYTSAPESEYSS